MTLDYYQYGKIYGPYTLDSDENFSFQQDVKFLTTNKFSLQEQADFDELEPEDVVGRFSFHLIFERENTPWKYEFFGGSNYVRVSNDEGGRWYLAEPRIEADVLYMGGVFGSSIADYAHRAIFCTKVRTILESQIRIPCTELDQTTAISYVSELLNVRSETSPGDPYGISAWTLHWVEDLQVSEDGTHAVFRCKYTTTPNAPELALVGSAVEEDMDTFTYTQFFELELNEDGYAINPSFGRIGDS